MPLTKVVLRPGIDKQATPTLNEGGWSDASLIRFRDGMPQNIGGWITQATGLSGKARGMISWASLDGLQNCGIGTNTNLYLYRGSSVFDITPSGFTAGPADTVVGYGFGRGQFGKGKFGQASLIPMVQQRAMTWTMDTWGEDLVAATNDGPIYIWVPNGNTVSVATVISQAPQTVRCVMVAMPERHLIAAGASDPAATTNYDPLLVRFSDVEDYTVWTATATNSAGSFRISGGSRIMQILTATNQHLIWTDKSLWTMQFIGSPYVFAFNQVGGDCGAVSAHAAGTVDGVTYWMSEDTFFQYRGAAPEYLDCKEHRAVFQNINRNQLDKVYCGLNAQNNEITWYYPSLGSTENDSYVTFNYAERLWYSGTMARTCWEDMSCFQYPLAVDPNGVLYFHEFGDDADGAYMPWYLQSGYFDMGDGTQYTYADRLIPDMYFDTGLINVSVKTLNYPDDAPTVKGPFPVAPSTSWINFRARGRQAAIRLENAGVTGTAFRLGAIRMNSSADGRR